MIEPIMMSISIPNSSNPRFPGISVLSNLILDLLEVHLIDPGGPADEIIELLTGFSSNLDNNGLSSRRGCKRQAHLRPRVIADEILADGIPPAIEKIDHLQIKAA